MRQIEFAPTRRDEEKSQETQDTDDGYAESQRRGIQANGRDCGNDKESPEDPKVDITTPM